MFATSGQCWRRSSNEGLWFSPTDRCTNISADFSKLDLSEVLQRSVKKAPIKEMTKEEIENEEQIKNEQKIERFTKTLTKFKASSNRKHQFPSKLSSFDRMLIHDIAESLGLYHYSEGLLEKRHIVVTKEPKMDKTVSKDMEPTQEDVPLPKESSSSHLTQRDDLVLPKASQAKKKSSAVTAQTAAAVPTKHCTLCGKNILAVNITTHRIGCEKKEREAIAVQKNTLEAKKLEADRASAEERVKAHRKKAEKEPSLNCMDGNAASGSQPNQGAKNKKGKGKKLNVATDDEEDFDAVLSSFNNTRCGLKSCGSGGGGLMLQSCCWCHTAYCLAHFVAEAHGCGHHAKADARAVS